MFATEDSDTLLHLNQGVSLDNQDLLLLLDALEALPAINATALRAGRLSRQLALLLGRGAGYRLGPVSATPLPAPLPVDFLPPLPTVHSPAARPRVQS